MSRILRANSPWMRDERIGALIWLVAAATISILGFWYPSAVANRNASPDDRFGFVLIIGFPFEVVGSIIAVKAVRKLLRIANRQPALGSQVAVGAGVLLAIISVSPVVIIGLRLLA